MFKSYLITAWRNVKKSKGFFALNFIGLYISIVSCLLIGLMILHETSFDKSAEPGRKLYRIVTQSRTTTGKDYNAVTPYVLAPALRAAMPGEELITEIDFERNGGVVAGDKKLMVNNILFADSVFPRLFPLKLVQGSLQRALSEKGFVVLTEKTARRFFGTESPIGKRMKLANVVDMEVAAVVEDAPANSHLPYEMIVSYPSFTKDFVGGIEFDQWSLSASGYTYIGLAGENQVAHTESILTRLVHEHKDKTEVDGDKEFKLQPVADIHFNQEYAASNPSYTINYQYLYLIGAIGLFLILAACINYVNLSTALAVKKSREVGVRKTMGATRRDLVGQFLSETFLLTGLVVLAAAMSVKLFLPLLNAFFGKNIPLSWLSWQSGMLLLALWVFVALLSGLYPSLILSGFNPILALKNKLSTPRRGAVTMRRGLVLFQFFTAQILIICAVVVTKQMAYMQSVPLGFKKEQVLDLSLPDNKPEKLSLLKSRLGQIAGVSDISFGLGAPVSDNAMNTGYNLKEKFDASQIPVQVKPADDGYLKTYGLQMLAGRWFDATDERNAEATLPDSLRHYSFILNEEGVKSLGFYRPEDAIGHYITFGINNLSGPIVGVVKNYNVTSLKKSVMPVLMVTMPYFYYNVGMKLPGGSSPSLLGSIEKAWASVYPNSIFETNFLDERVAAQYKEERRTQQLFGLFTALSIAINILGLIGLLSFMIEQKTKEIGIRKVLGASIRDISMLLSKDFLRLILLAFLIATPVAWMLMHRWLNDFAYRTHITWWVFGVAVSLVLVVTCIAVGFQTLRAAVANPVKGLRSE